MTKKTKHASSFLAITDHLKLVMKIITVLLMVGSLQAFSAPYPDTGNDLSDLQQLRVTGKITDADGNAMPAVNIIEKGTTNGVISEADGSYTITVSSGNAVLSFSFIGYVTQEINVANQATLNVVLREMTSYLDEVVVVGYSTQQRKTLTGAVSTVNAENLAETTSPSALSRLQGRAAGVTILNSHTPGADPTIRIRGMGTINNASPLWVVDGVPGGTVAPSDIETISILKDAAAQAIYGARAANGVVLVTTKTGKRNQSAQINVNVRQGITRNSNYYKLLNTREYGEMLWLEFKNSGVAPNHPQYGTGATPVIPDYIRPTAASEGDPSVDPALYDNKMAHLDGDDTYLIMRANKEGTEWLKEAERDAKFKEYTVDVTGGTANTTYAFQLGYILEEGIMKYTGYDRYNFRSNITTNPVKWIEIGERVGVTYNEDWGTQGDNSESSAISWTYRMQPIVPVYDIMGNFAGTRASGTGNAGNPIFNLWSNKDDRTRRLIVSGNTYLKLNILEGLSVRSLIGVNYSTNHSKNYDFVEIAEAERGKYDGYSESTSYSYQWSWTNTIEYAKLFAGTHDLRVILGSEAIEDNSSNFNASRTEYTFLDLNYITLGTGLQGIDNGGGMSSYSLFSLFGRFNYSFADKYLVEGVVRRDGSSRFGKEKYGVFPAFSLGWRVSEEGFMGSTSSWLDELKIRAGWGQTGNDRIGNYNSFSNFSTSFNNTFYPIDGSNTVTGALGFAQSTFGNTDVKWEATSTSNIGIDASLFNKLNVTLDLWQRVTTDMLYPKQIPLVLGRASSPDVNVGEMKNSGFDLELGYSDDALNGDLRYNINLVVSRYKNELVKLTGTESEFYQGSAYREQRYTRTESGRAFPEFYGYIVEGIFQTQAEVDAAPPAFGPTGTYNKPGHYKYRDANGDGFIDANDRVYIGSPHPDFTAGLNFNISYKGLSLSTQLFSSVGNEMMNYVKRFIDFVQFQGGRSYDRLYNSWGSPYLSDNTKAKLPMAEVDDTPSQTPSSAFIEDASYLRMKTLRVSYDLGTLFPGKLRNIQVYGQISNPFTITKYSGLDPEVGGSGINMGIDSGAWPTPRQFMFGISLGI